MGLVGVQVPLRARPSFALSPVQRLRLLPTRHLNSHSGHKLVTTPSTIAPTATRRLHAGPLGQGARSGTPPARRSGVYGSMARDHGQFSRVAGPVIILAGTGEPDLANCAFVNSTTASTPALGTQRSTVRSKALSPGSFNASGSDEGFGVIVTRAVGDPDLASWALVNSPTVSLCSWPPTYLRPSQKWAGAARPGWTRRS